MNLKKQNSFFLFLRIMNIKENSKRITLEVKATEMDEVADIIKSFIFMLEDTRIDRDIREQYLETCKPLKERFFVRIDK